MQAIQRLQPYRDRLVAPRDWRVNTKLIVAMLAVVLLAVAVVSASAQLTLSGSLTASERRGLHDQTERVASEIGSDLARKAALVEYTGKTPRIVDYFTINPSQRFPYIEPAREQLLSLRQQDPSLNAVGLLTLDGEWVLDSTAQNVASTVGQNQGARDFFQAAKAGQVAISNLEVSPVTNRPSIFFAAPIRDRQNNLIGVLAARADVESLQQTLTRAEGAGRQAMLLDEHGIVLLHSSNNERFQFRGVAPLSARAQQEVREGKRFGNAVQDVQTLPASGLAEGFGQGTDVDHFQYSLGGQTLDATMEPVPNTPWRVVLSVPEQVITSPVAEQTRRNLLLALLVAALAVAVGYVAARQLTRPLTELEGAARRIGAGDYDVRVPVHGNDELGQVAQTVNSMVDQVTANAQAQAEQNAALQRQIVQLLDEVSAVAEGDLTVEAEVSAGSLGAVADSFNYMIAELRQIVGRVNQVTHQVGASTETILSTTTLLARSAEQQAGQIAETSGAVETMATSIQQVSQNAATSAQVARQARESAVAGSHAVAATVAGMGRIREQVEETARKITRLGESSQQIGQIVSLIRDVADQTELLALNAAIQAAMAGEHGKGFAVVAEEVRRLAERTGEASKQIDTLVKGIQAETTEAVAAMEQGTREVVGGSQVADEAGRSLQAIDQIVAQLAALIEQISQAAEQQAHASAGIAQAMSQISSVTQETAAGAEEASGSVATLTRLADDLRAGVAAFRLERPATAPDYSLTGANGTGNGHVAEYAGVGGQRAR